jgi:WD40 repeat protein
VVGGLGLVQTSPNASKAHPHNVFFHLDRSLMRAILGFLGKIHLEHAIKISPANHFSDGVVYALHSPNGDFVLSLSEDDLERPLSLWSTKGGRLQRHCDFAGLGMGAPRGRIACFFSLDGRAVFGVRGNRLRSWDAGTGALQRTFGQNDVKVEFCCLSPDGKSIFTGSQELGSTLMLWDTVGGTRLWRRPEFTNGIYYIYIIYIYIYINDTYTINMYVYIYMCVCVCVCMYVYIYTYRYIYIYIYIYK